MTESPSKPRVLAAVPCGSGARREQWRCPRLAGTQCRAAQSGSPCCQSDRLHTNPNHQWLATQRAAHAARCQARRFRADRRRPPSAGARAWAPREPARASGRRQSLTLPADRNTEHHSNSAKRRLTSATTASQSSGLRWLRRNRSMFEDEPCLNSSALSQEQALASKVCPTTHL